MLRGSDPGAWIVAGKIHAGPYPRSAAAYARLAQAGVLLCVNLSNRPLSAENLRAHELTEVHLPVSDFTAPSPAVLAQAVDAIDRSLASGGAVAVNCGAGLGRTGTVVAAWLVSQGASADDAIALVRERRPGSIETQDQEFAVRAFADAPR